MELTGFINEPYNYTRSPCQQT